jgi:hypothetical protein
MGKRHEKLSTWKKCEKCGRPLKAKFESNPHHVTCFKCHLGEPQLHDLAFCLDAGSGKMTVYCAISGQRYLTTFDFAHKIKDFTPAAIGELVAKQLDQVLFVATGGGALQIKDRPRFEVREWQHMRSA